MKIRVYYEDTDTAGVVYHSNYINFCERARSEAFFEKGLKPFTDNGQFVATKIVADFLVSTRLGDMLEVKTELVEMKRVSFVLFQTIYKDEKLVFKMQITMAYITFDGKLQKLDDYIKELILSLF